MVITTITTTITNLGFRYLSFPSCVCILSFKLFPGVSSLCVIPIESVPLFIHVPFHPKGYLDFYIRTKNIRRAPFYILSVGNAVLMIVVMILHDLCDSGKGCSHTFTKVDYLRSPL